MVSNKINFPLFLFVLTPQVLQAPWVSSSELWAGYPPVHHEDWLYFCPLEVHALYEFTLSSISLPSPSILSPLLENKKFRLGLWLSLSFLLEHQCHLCVLPKQITVGYFALQRSTPSGEVTSCTLYFWDKSLWFLRIIEIFPWEVTLPLGHFPLTLLFSVTPSALLLFLLDLTFGVDCWGSPPSSVASFFLLGKSRFLKQWALLCILSTSPWRWVCCWAPCWVSVWVWSSWASPTSGPATSAGMPALGANSASSSRPMSLLGCFSILMMVVCVTSSACPWLMGASSCSSVWTVRRRQWSQTSRWTTAAGTSWWSAATTCGPCWCWTARPSPGRCVRSASTWTSSVTSSLGESHWTSVLLPWLLMVFWVSLHFKDLSWILNMAILSRSS